MPGNLLKIYESAVNADKVKEIIKHKVFKIWQLYTCTLAISHIAFSLQALFRVSDWSVDQIPCHQLETFSETSIALVSTKEETRYVDV